MTHTLARTQQILVALFAAVAISTVCAETISSPTNLRLLVGTPAPLNSVDTIVSDMRELNDQVLPGIPSNIGWARGPGNVVMGNIPRGTNTPSWWNPANTAYKSSAWWNAVLPWFVVFDGIGNTSTNSRVQVRRLNLYVKSRATGTWIAIDYNEELGGYQYIKDANGAPDPRLADVRMESDGAMSIKVPGGNLMYHGWSVKHAINASDVGAVFATMQARLVVNNSALPDDRAGAKYLVHVGADYYPDLTTSDTAFAPAGFNPGIGLGRAKMVTNDWRAFNFCTINVGDQLMPNSSISVSELQAAPPPLE